MYGLMSRSGDQTLTEVIQPGRWRGLQTSSTDSGIFTILAFDQRESYRKMLPEGVNYQQATENKREIVAALSPYTSAVLLDPDYGLLPAAPGHLCGGQQAIIRV